MLQQSTYIQNWNCIVTSQRLLYNLSIQALVNLRKEFERTHSAAADEGCNRSISLRGFDQLGPKLRALPPKFEKPAYYSSIILYANST